MRVGIVCHHGYGGSVRTAVDLSSVLARGGHEVQIFSRRPPLGSTLHGPGVIVRSLGEAEPPTAALHRAWPAAEAAALAERLVEADARGLDVVHFHYALPFAGVVASVRNRLNAAVVGTFHGTDVEAAEGSETLAGTLRAAFRHVDAVTTVSASYARRVGAVVGIEPRVIPNFVDADEFHPSPSPRPARPVIAHISNFRTVKAPLLLADIASQVLRETNAELWLIGDGDGLPEVLDIMAGRGLSERVRSFGFRTRVAPLLRRCDLLVSSSRSESFGIAALEAAASGIPVVAPRVGGLIEVVRDGVTGVLYSPGDVSAAVAAVRRVLGDPALRARMGQAARAHARAYRPERVVPRYVELYRSLTDAVRLRRVGT